MPRQHDWTYDEWTDANGNYAYDDNYCSLCLRYRTHPLKPDGTEDFSAYIPDEDEPPCEGIAT
jgi:hypothetical protein